MNYLYENNLPFNNEMAFNLDKQIERIESNKASLIIVDGGVGQGKTTLAVHIADYLNQKHIVFDEQLAMGGKDFLEKLRICFKKKYKVVIYDEAGDFNKRGALSRFNAMLNRTFETYTAFKIIVILVLPSFNVLDNDIFDKQIPRMLIHCMDRDANGHFRAFSLFKMMYLRDKMKKIVVKPQAYMFVLPNFRGHFKDLTPERSRELDRISTKGKIEELEKAEVKIDGLLNYTELASRMACSVSKVQMYLKEIGIKADKYIKARAYYNEDVINAIMDHLDRKSLETEERRKVRKENKLKGEV